MASLSLPTLGGTDYPTRVQALFDGCQLVQTFTPTLGGSATYTTQIGRYLRAGNIVHVWIALVVNSLGTGSTTTISGLPFTAANSSMNYSGSISYFTGLAANVIFIAPLVAANTSTIVFNSINASGASISVSTAIFGNSAGVVLHVSYEAAP